MLVCIYWNSSCCPTCTILTSRVPVKLRKRQQTYNYYYYYYKLTKIQNNEQTKRKTILCSSDGGRGKTWLIVSTLLFTWKPKLSASLPGCMGTSPPPQCWSRAPPVGSGTAALLGNPRLPNVPACHCTRGTGLAPLAQASPGAPLWCGTPLLPAEGQLSLQGHTWPPFCEYQGPVHVVQHFQTRLGVPSSSVLGSMSLFSNVLLCSGSVMEVHFWMSLKGGVVSDLLGSLSPVPPGGVV